MKDFIKNSILAGILISLGGFAFLMAGNLYVGAFVFTIGLISVIFLKANLYTGQVGYTRKLKEIPPLIGMCALNLAGAILIGWATSPLVGDLAREVVNKKFAHTPLETLILSAICGALIYLAVELFKRRSNILCIVIPVFTFVAIGADHCIANAYYISAAGMFHPETLKMLGICIVGNALGSLIISLLQVNPKPVSAWEEF